jgi:3-dehydroquinate dehydratase type I
MKYNSICVAIVENNLEAIEKAGDIVDLYEVRIDLIGEQWREVANKLSKPWIATCRRGEDMGGWKGEEKVRIQMLMEAVEMGADIVDIEVNAPGLKEMVPAIKKKAKCLISYHNFEGTPDYTTLVAITKDEIAAGADICKIVTTAKAFEDNISVLKLIREFKHKRIISFAMGVQGMISRILCPLLGGYYTYASVQSGKESAPGQIAVDDLNTIYKLIKGS